MSNHIDTVPTKLISVNLGLNIIHGRFIKRLNRFTILVEIEGETSEAYMPNPGRLLELLKPSASLILKRKDRGKIPFELVAIRDADMVVPIDSRLPNKLFHMALVRHALSTFASYNNVRAEYRYGSSRFDFLLSSKDGRCIIEVKSCTLVKNSVALFPDAPTERGTRHAQELAKAVGEGFRSCFVFIVQRSDAAIMRPYWENDPKFAKALSDAARKGVEVLAWRIKPLDESLLVTLGERIPVDASLQSLES